MSIFDVELTIPAVFEVEMYTGPAGQDGADGTGAGSESTYTYPVSSLTDEVIFTHGLDMDPVAAYLKVGQVTYEVFFEIVTPGQSVRVFWGPNLTGFVKLKF